MLLKKVLKYQNILFASKRAYKLGILFYAATGIC
jgi:hypothetical protein